MPLVEEVSSGESRRALPRVGPYHRRQRTRPVVLGERYVCTVVETLLLNDVEVLL